MIDITLCLITKGRYEFLEPLLQSFDMSGPQDTQILSRFMLSPKTMLAVQPIGE